MVSESFSLGRNFLSYKHFALDVCRVKGAGLIAACGIFSVKTKCHHTVMLQFSNC